MFATYDYTKSPEVKVTFHGNINIEQDFTDFTKQWYDLYEKKTNFTFLFDMSDISMISPFYCYKMAFFIHDLKQQPIQYLQSSKIYNINSFIYGLLRLIFAIQSPVAPVTILYDDSEYLINP
jgi:hypothetical protein